MPFEFKFQKPAVLNPLFEESLKTMVGDEVAAGICHVVNTTRDEFVAILAKENIKCITDVFPIFVVHATHAQFKALAKNESVTSIDAPKVYRASISKLR